MQKSAFEVSANSKDPDEPAEADLRLCFMHMPEDTVFAWRGRFSTMLSYKTTNRTAMGPTINIHYENTSIQIFWKFHHQKLKVFR